MERFSSSQGHYELHYELAESMFRRRRGSLTCKTDGKLGNTTRTVTAASTASRSSRVLVKKKKKNRPPDELGSDSLLLSQTQSAEIHP